MTALPAKRKDRTRATSAQRGARAPAIAHVALTVVGCLLVAMLAANIWVVGATRDRVFDDIQRLTVHDIGLVLGTSPYTRYGSYNELFAHRMRAAADLYAAGRVRHLLVSGANPSSRYNEPRKMYQSLRRLGVPDAAITLDFAGFRTLDSIVRAQRVFGLASFVVVSQRYHDYRALFLADHYGIDAVAYVQPDEDRRQPLRTEAREYLARVKAVLDLFVFRTEPHFLGPRRPIEIEPARPFNFLVLSRHRHMLWLPSRLRPFVSGSACPHGLGRQPHAGPPLLIRTGRRPPCGDMATLREKRTP